MKMEKEFERGYEKGDKEGKMNLKDFILDGLCTDGGHHKQWYLEQILIKLGFDLETLRKEFQKEGYDWDESIAP